MTLRRLRQILKLLADDTRLRIIALLSKQELTVSELSDILQVTQPNLSRHLARLRLTGLVVDHRQGQNVYYRPADTTEGLQRKLLRTVTDALAGLDVIAQDVEKLRKIEQAGRVGADKGGRRNEGS